ncbi:MAG: hypothetical protein ACREDM_04545 [Methylocella sp.]
MQFRIADTFTDSLARLTGDAQKAVKTTAFDLQLNPANPGMSFHKLDKAQEEVYDTERHLLYVACTRARDHLLVTGVDPVSEFLDDIMKGDQG